MENKLLYVCNWDKWQTYRKDRGTPPWIKVHRNLLSNPEWSLLTDAEKGQLVSIWIVAADKKGVISSSSRILMKICQLDDEPDISKFIELGFLSAVCQPGGNQAVTMNPQSDATETETEAYTETENTTHPQINQNTTPSSQLILGKHGVTAGDCDKTAIPRKPIYIMDGEKGGGIINDATGEVMPF